ncbi:MAG: SpoIID/LytB domain-containing protein [Candidatus Hydrogenedentes bacterium]|nr:SpoIID/LytB domain-containing protein [Candidatus Hydrogenedentota bacterium]
MHLYWRICSLFTMTFLILFSSPVIATEDDFVDPQKIQAYIRYATLPGEVALKFSSPLTLHTAERTIELPPGEWTFKASEIHPAPKRFHVFPKSFQPDKEKEMNTYINSWRDRGYDPIVKTFGLLFKTSSGHTRDNRVHWISLARFNTKKEAQALIAKLKKEPVWAWMRQEKTGSGHAVFTVCNKSNTVHDNLSSPISLSSPDALELKDMSCSFWKARKANRLLSAPLSIDIGMDSAVEVYGYLPVELYLRGVLPAEMPANWPEEALKAQAVVARSEIYASLATKYKLEGFDFTALESCRAYWGLGGHHANTDTAIQATMGQALVHNDKFATTVFSACCGGWTENNENVWSGPPNPILRGVSDYASKQHPSPPRSKKEWRQRIKTTPNAWCSDDSKGFRWKKRFSNRELSKLVNQRYAIGTIRSIREGERGVSGRLKSVTITGSKDTVTVKRELAIRQAFGGLPSAMFIIDVSNTNGVPATFVFYGGGRGHGVGLCQYGARGMAVAGRNYEEIVTHYFEGVTIERTR